MWRTSFLTFSLLAGLLGLTPSGVLAQPMAGASNESKLDNLSKVLSDLDTRLKSGEEQREIFLQLGMKVYYRGETLDQAKRQQLQNLADGNVETLQTFHDQMTTLLNAWKGLDDSLNEQDLRSVSLGIKETEQLVSRYLTNEEPRRSMALELMTPLLKEAITATENQKYAEALQEIRRAQSEDLLRLVTQTARLAESHRDLGFLAETKEEKAIARLVKSSSEMVPLLQKITLKVSQDDVRTLRFVAYETQQLLEDGLVRDGSQSRIADVEESITEAISLLEKEETEEALEVLSKNRIAEEQRLAKVRKKWDWESWRKLPVLHQGRIKPLDSIANEMTMVITARPKWEDVRTEIKYPAHELVFLWVNDTRDEWVGRPVVRCEYQPLRRILDSRQVTDELTIAQSGESTEIAFPGVEQTPVSKGSISGTILFSGNQQQYRFSVTSDDVFLFEPVLNSSQQGGELLADIPAVNDFLKPRRTGWSGSLVRNSLVKPVGSYPVGGDVDWSTGEVTIRFSEPPKGDVQLLLDYSFRRNEINEKGTYVSVADVLDWQKSFESGRPTYWSSDLEERLQNLAQGRRNDKKPQQIGDTPSERQLNEKVGELAQHLQLFLSVLKARTLHVVPSVDPRVLAKPVNPDDVRENWVSLAAVLRPREWENERDITMAAITSDNYEELYSLVERDILEEKYLLQLTGVAGRRGSLQRNVDEIRSTIQEARKSYGTGNEEKFSKHLTKFLDEMQDLGDNLNRLRLDLAPVDREDYLRDVHTESLNRLRMVQIILNDPAVAKRVKTPRQQELLESLTQTDVLRATLAQLPNLERSLQIGQVPERQLVLSLSQLAHATAMTLLEIDPTLQQEASYRGLGQTMAFGQHTGNVIDKYEPLELYEDQIKQAQYPAPGHTDLEVFYNDQKPFARAWIIFLLALIIVVLSLMVKAQKAMYTAGLVVTLLAILYSTWGFALRVRISGRPPVANMYETVVWVAYVVGFMGLWFCLLPLTWPGLSWAWRMTSLPIRPKRGVPGSRKITGLELDQPSSADRNRAFAEYMQVAQIGGSVLRLILFGWLMYFVTASDTTFKIISWIPPIHKQSFSFGSFGVWLVGFPTTLLSCWYLSHAVVAILGALIVGYPEARSQGDKLWEQTVNRRFFLLGALPVACFGMMLAHFVGIRNPDILNPRIGSITAVLRNNYWLTIHVLTIVSSYGAGALAWGMGNMAMFYYLFGRYRNERSNAALVAQHLGTPAADGEESGPVFDREAEEGVKDGLGARMKKTASVLKPGAIGGTLKAGLKGLGAGDEHLETSKVRPPREVATLASFSYKSMQVAVLLLAVGTILGGLWADVSWGRFWDWDPKEVWALISLLVYLAVLHGRFAGWVGTFGTNVGSVLCFNAILMSWYGVNFILPKVSGWLDGSGGTEMVGLHSYASGDADGLRYIVYAVLANLVLVIAAWGRFYVETINTGTPEAGPDPAPPAPEANA